MLTFLIAGSLALTISGCSNTGAVVEPPAVTTPAEPTPAPVTTTAKECPSTAPDVTLEGFAYNETVEDEYGCYARISIAEDNPILVLDESLYPLNVLTSSGLTDVEVEQFYLLALNFFVKETLDSVVLDNSASDQVWLDDEDVKNYFRDASVSSIVESVEADGLGSLGLVISNVLPEPGLRDNVPRQDELNLFIANVESLTGSDGLPYLTVRVQGQSLMVFEDEPFRQWILKNDTSLVESQLRSTRPELFDNVSDNIVLLSVESSISVQSGKIIGSSFSYDTEIATGTEVLN